MVKKISTIFKKNYIVILMIICIFIFTVGQFIPLYFNSPATSRPFYIAIFILLVITVCISSYRTMYLPHKNNWVYSAIISLLSTAIASVVFGVFALDKTLVVWTDATTIYINKNNPKIEIVSRYINEGAFGGGTKSGDYEIVLKRPIIGFLKIETNVDTNTIDKKEWLKATFIPH